MAGKKIKRIGLPLETKVEIIGFSKGKAFKKIVSYQEALDLKKKKPEIQIYQVGFSQYKNVTEL